MYKETILQIHLLSELIYKASVCDVLVVVVAVVVSDELNIDKALRGRKCFWCSCRLSTRAGWS